MAVEAAIATVRGAWPAGADLDAQVLTAAHAAAAAVRARAQALETRPRELACTLMVILWCGGHVAVAHIGDGAVAGHRAEGEWEVLSLPQESEYVNETRFLTDTDWRAHLRVTEAEGAYEGLVAFTDGCQRAALLRNGDGLHRPFAGFLDPLARFARRACKAAAAPPEGEGSTADPSEPLQGLLQSAKLRDASDDDKTLVLIWRDTADG